MRFCYFGFLPLLFSSTLAAQQISAGITTGANCLTGSPSGNRAMAIPTSNPFIIPESNTASRFVVGPDPSRRVFRGAPDTNSHFGATVGAGLKLQYSRLIAEPMFRYTRWTKEGRSPNQLEFLVSFRGLVKR